MVAVPGDTALKAYQWLGDEWPVQSSAWTTSGLSERGAALSPFLWAMVRTGRVLVRSGAISTAPSFPSALARAPTTQSPGRTGSGYLQE